MLFQFRLKQSNSLNTNNNHSGRTCHEKEKRKIDRIDLLHFDFSFICRKSFSQMQQIVQPGVYSEGNFYEQHGILYVDAIVVKFKDRVIDLPRGVRYAAKNNIRSNFPAVKRIVNNFEKKFEPITIVKQIPNARWGDVTRRHKLTGELVRIHDLSQLFTFRFAKPIPLDSALNEFRKLPVVEFAHEPVSIVYFDEPNDSKFQNQWNLAAVNALAAWDITRGSNSIRIGIVDTGTDQDHEDLFAKIAGGDGVEQGADPNKPNRNHGTWVAGVAGAKTNNGKGVASLGWEILLNTYGGYPGDVGDESFAVEDISQATSDGVDVINMSWGTFRNATLLDIPIGCPVTQKWVDNAIIPHSYPEIDSVITNAIAQGVICIAAAGNTSPNAGGLPNPELCDPSPVPFPSYPAQQPADVIAVSGTKLENGIEQFNDDWNYGNFVDISAPGKSIWTTDFGGGYITLNGTSFSAPLVSALAALIRSINPSLTVQQVTSVITSAADKIDATRYPYDSNGWNSRLGYGRIDAYAVVLKALDDLPDRRSNMENATAGNSGRKLVRDSIGNYHLVYQAGNQVFYAQKASSWSPDERISDALGEYGFASIAERGGNLYVVWQEKTGTASNPNHNISFRRYTSGSWNAAQTLAGSVGSNDPLPVIASPASNEIVVAYRSGNSIQSKRSTNNGSSWSTETLAGTALNSPSLAAARTPWGAVTTALAYATNDLPNSSDIIIHYFYNGAWGQQNNLSANLPGNLSQHAHPCIAASGDFSNWSPHTAWDAYDSQYSSRVILHKHTWSSGSSTYYEFHYQDEDRPSITGLAGTKAAMAFRRGDSYFFYGTYNGNYWSIQFPPVAGKYPSFSEGTVYAKYAYTSAGSAPYEIKLNSGTFSKAAQPMVAAKGMPTSVRYHRALGLADHSAGSWLNLRVEDYFIKHEDGSVATLDFIAPPPDTAHLSLAEAWAALSSANLALPNDADSLIIVLSAAGENAPNLGTGSKPLIVQFKATTVEAHPSEKAFLPLAFISDQPFNEKSRSMAISARDFSVGKIVSIRAEAANQKQGVALSLGHIYEITEEAVQKRQSQRVQSELPRSFDMDAYPNPFNPSTTIAFELPQPEHVTLRIYNIRGQVVRELLNEFRSSGKHRIPWDGRDDLGQNVASGMYLVQLQTTTQTLRTKILRIR